jgi:hypothetical protein
MSGNRNLVKRPKNAHNNGPPYVQAEMKVECGNGFQHIHLRVFKSDLKRALFDISRGDELSLEGEIEISAYVSSGGYAIPKINMIPYEITATGRQGCGQYGDWNEADH